MITIDLKAIFQDKKVVFWLLVFLIIVFSVILLIPKSTIAPTSNYFEEKEVLWKVAFEKGLHFYETEELDSAFQYFSESASEVKFIDTFSISSYYWMSKCLYELNLLDSAIFVIEKGLATRYQYSSSSRSSYFSNYNDLLKTYFLQGEMYREAREDPEYIYMTYLGILDLAKQRKDTLSLIRSFEEIVKYSDKQDLEIIPFQIFYTTYEEYLYRKPYDTIPPLIANVISNKLINIFSQTEGWYSTFDYLSVEMSPLSNEQFDDFDREDKNIFYFNAHLKYSEYLRENNLLDSAKTHLAYADIFANKIALPEVNYIYNLQKGKFELSERRYESAEKIFRSMLHQGSLSLNDSIEVIVYSGKTDPPIPGKLTHPWS